jgi:hypothetical protein
MNVQRFGHRGVDRVEEFAELPRALADDFAALDIERREQRCRAWQT